MTNPTSAGLFAPPRHVSSVDDCHFYHTMDVPGYGCMRGEWDLRGGEVAYLGGLDVRGKRVLEIGTASGFMCFYMERAGADVVAFDLSPEYSIDVVPYAGLDCECARVEFKSHIGRVNNAYWLSHPAYGSRARVVYGTVYDIPQELGTFDVSTLGSVLLHLRDPFLALQNVLAHTREAVVITDKSQSALYRLPLRLSDKLGRALFFRPDASTKEPIATWWRLTPQALQRMIAVLGFGKTTVTYHRQTYLGRKQPLFTLVGERTEPLEPAE